MLPSMSFLLSLGSSWVKCHVNLHLKKSYQSIHSNFHLKQANGVACIMTAYITKNSNPIAFRWHLIIFEKKKRKRKNTLDKLVLDMQKRLDGHIWNSFGYTMIRVCLELNNIKGVSLIVWLVWNSSQISLNSYTILKAIFENVLLNMQTTGWSCQERSWSLVFSNKVGLVQDKNTM